MSPFFRPAQRHQRMVCFDEGGDRFQMRAAGIALRNGRVLVQNVTGDPLTTIPGGRIDQNEASPEAVIREMAEEFGLAVTLGPLAFIIESFSGEAGRSFHEVGFYYPILAPERFPYHDHDVCHRFDEGPVEVEYRWVETSPAALSACRLVPEVLQTRLGVLPGAVEHIVNGRLR